MVLDQLKARLKQKYLASSDSFLLIKDNSCRIIVPSSLREELFALVLYCKKVLGCSEKIIFEKDKSNKWFFEIKSKDFQIIVEFEYKIIGLLSNSQKYLEYKQLAKEQLRKYDLQNEIIENLPVKNAYENVMQFYLRIPFYYDSSNIFYLWNHEKNHYLICDETDLINAIEQKFAMHGNTTTSSIRTEYLNAFKMVGRRNKPKEVPSSWLHFQNFVVDLESGEEFPPTSDFFFTAPIPWEPSRTMETPIIDKLFEEWIGPKYKETLKEVLAYCCLDDYPIHRAFGLIGDGRNGKSTYLRLVEKFIGGDNITSTSLEGIKNNRFESFKLYRKKVAQVGETNHKILDDTDLFKRLTGQDQIPYEKKGKTPFSGHNTAKIMIASNSLPTSTDKTDGFYRRWLILDFPNQFPEGKNILDTIPTCEYNNLVRYCINILPKLLGRGTFTGEGSISQRKEKYIMASNPLPYFIKHLCKIDHRVTMASNVVLNAYKQFLIANKKRVVSRKEFTSAMEDEGYFQERKEGGMHLIGITLADNWNLQNKIIKNE